MHKVLLLIVLFVFIFTPSSWADDISGIWTISVSGQQGEITMDMDIKAAGEDLTFNAIHPKLGDMAGTGRLNGNDITMNITTTGERKFGFEINGTVTGNKMTGVGEFIMPSGAQTGQGGKEAMSNAWTAEKK